jgi:hypothetical protein
VRSRGLISALLVAGLLACTHAPDAGTAYQARRDDYRRTLTARQNRGETVAAADDSALRALESLLRPIVGELGAPWIAGRGRINLETLLPGDMASGLPDGILYQSADHGTEVLVTTRDLIRSWIAREFGDDTTVSRDPAVALGNADVLTQVFNADAHVEPYTEIPVDASRSLGIISAKLVTRSQDYSPRAADELMISVARGARIFIIDTPAHDTLPIPPACVAVAESGRARSRALVDSASRATPRDTSLLAAAVRNDDATNALFRRCYGDDVVHQPQFQGLVAQVRRLVESLPAR